VAISPQREEFSRQLIKKHNLTFPLLRDQGNAYAERLKVAFQLSDDLRELYQGLDIDLERYNGDDSWVLPLPAGFVVDTEGIIRVAEVSADYTVRPEPEDLLQTLSRL